MKVEWQRDEIKWKEDKVCWRQARKDWEIDLANAKIQASNDHAEVNMNVICSKYYNSKVTEEFTGFSGHVRTVRYFYGIYRKIKSF